MTRDEAITRVVKLMSGPDGDEGYPPAVIRAMLAADPVAQAIKANPGLVVDAISQQPASLRFIIGPVVVENDQIRIVEFARIDASGFDEAATIAKANFPDCQIMVVQVGRILNVAVEDHLQLGQAGGA